MSPALTCVWQCKAEHEHICWEYMPVECSVVLHSIQKLASQLSFCAAAEKPDRSRHKGSLIYLSACIMYINNKTQPLCMRCHFLMFPSCNVNLALSVSVWRLIVPLSWDLIHCGLPSPHSKYPAPRHTHTHTDARAHLHRSRENTHFNGLRYRYRTRALTFPSASLCSTSVRTTGYPCPPKPHTPHLHINLLFNIILCHSRPICHSASRPPPSSRSIHILHPGPSLVPLSASLTRNPLSPWGVIFFSFNSSFKWKHSPVHQPISSFYPLFLPSISTPPPPNRPGPCLVSFFALRRVLIEKEWTDGMSWKEKEEEKKDRGREGGGEGDGKRECWQARTHNGGPGPAYQLTSNQM